MDTSPTALFDSYEQDFRQFIETIRDKLEGDAKEARGEQRSATLRQVEMELDEADEMVSQMDIEIQGIPQSVRAQYHTRLRAAKADLSRYKTLAADVRGQLARSDLLSIASQPGNYPASDDPYGPSSDRTRLLAGTSILEDGTKRLQQSQRIALETEDQGAEILSNLRQQREQIENSRNTIHPAIPGGLGNRPSIRNSEEDGQTISLTPVLSCRMYQQRAVTAGIIIVLILLIAVITWEKLS